MSDACDVYWQNTQAGEVHGAVNNATGWHMVRVIGLHHSRREARRSLPDSCDPVRRSSCCETAFGLAGERLLHAADSI